MYTERRQKSLTTKETAAVAEIIVNDPRYRNALNAPYLDTDDVDVDAQHVYQEHANDILIHTMKEMSPDASPEVHAWERSRQAIIALLSRQALGSFESYFFGPDAIQEIPHTKPEELPEGDRAVVATNSRIVRYAASIDDPTEFFDTSLGIIERQKKLGYEKIGPENYATALKFFADKYSIVSRDMDNPDTESLTLPDLPEVRSLTSEALRGLFDVARRDEPNYLEMTNIYAAIRALPKGVVSPKYTKDILLYTAKNMDDYTDRVSTVLLGAIAKLDTHEYPLEASTVVNMTLKHGIEFQTTRDVRTTLRAIDSLMPNIQTDEALESFFELVNGFDQPLELDGIDEVVDRLRHIVEEVTEDPSLSEQAQAFAQRLMKRANGLARQQLASGSLTQAQMQQLKDVYFRIKQNCQSL